MSCILSWTFLSKELIYNLTLEISAVGVTNYLPNRLLRHLPNILAAKTLLLGNRFVVVKGGGDLLHYFYDWLSENKSKLKNGRG